LSLGFFLYLYIPATQASVPSIELDGYAWSENIGWISLNCKSGSATGSSVCATSDYKVVINDNQTVTGYAWSENIGWIKFGGLSSFPVGGGTTNSNASVTGLYPNLVFTGWARACAGTLGGDCSNMNSDINSGGWDGWISLNGTGYSVSASASGMNSNSYAWGGEVVGWIDMFTNVSWSAPVANLTGVGCQIPGGSSTCNGSLTWSILPVNTPQISILRLTAPASQISNSPSLSNQSIALTQGNNVFVARTGAINISPTLTLVATCASGSVYNGSVCANTPPTLTIEADKRIVRIGETVRVTWTINNLLDGNCNLSGTGMPTGSVTTSGSQTSGIINNLTQFTIKCTGSYGTVEALAVTEVIPSSREI
jgi:hypothetical protein